MWKLWCGPVSIAMSRWSDPRPLASAAPLIMGSHWVSSWMSCCPVLWRPCSFGSVVSSPSHAPAVHREVNLGLLGWSALQLSFIVTTGVSPSALPWPANLMQPIARRWVHSPAVPPRKDDGAISHACCSGYKREWGLAILLSLMPSGLAGLPSNPNNKVSSGVLL